MACDGLMMEKACVPGDREEVPAPLRRSSGCVLSLGVSPHARPHRRNGALLSTASRTPALAEGRQPLAWEDADDGAFETAGACCKPGSEGRVVEASATAPREEQTAKTCPFVKILLPLSSVRPTGGRWPPGPYLPPAALHGPDYYFSFAASIALTRMRMSFTLPTQARISSC